MEKLILIHGALGNKKEVEEVKKQLNSDYNVYSYELPHHGERFDSELAFEINDLITDLSSYIDSIGSCYIYGFSLGGYLALATILAKKLPVKGIITHGTKLNWSPKEAKKEIKNLNLQFLSNKVPSFYSYLKQLHGSYLPLLLEKTATFMNQLGTEPYLTPEKMEEFPVPIRYVRGGRDKMVTKEETLLFHSQSKNSYYFEVPHWVHPIGFIRPKHLAQMIKIQLDSFSYQWVDTFYGKISYKLVGDNTDKNKPLLLFLHEALGSIAKWETFPDRLCEKSQLPGLVIELPGYGFSSPDTTSRDYHYLHRFSWEVIPEILEKCKINQPLIIVGHSDGGTIALLFSSKFPSTVKAVFTLAAHYINEKETREGIYPAIDAHKEGKLNGLELFHGDKTERLFHAWSDTWLTTSFKTWDISEDIKENAVPAFIIQGDSDQYGTKKQVEGITKLLTNATPYFIKNCGHSPHLEKEEEVIALINEKIRSFIV